MNYIHQREENDCGIAVAAMLTDKTYDDVHKAVVKAITDGQIDPVAEAGGLTFDDLHSLLEWYLTGLPWIFWPEKEGKSVKDVAGEQPGFRVGVALRDPTRPEDTGHLIVCEAGRIYDPRQICSGPAAVEEYEFKDLPVRFLFYQEPP